MDLVLEYQDDTPNGGMARALFPAHTPSLELNPLLQSLSKYGPSEVQSLLHKLSMSPSGRGYRMWLEISSRGMELSILDYSSLTNWQISISTEDWQKFLSMLPETDAKEIALLLLDPSGLAKFLKRL